MKYATAIITLNIAYDAEKFIDPPLKNFIEWAINSACTELETNKIEVDYKLKINE